MPTLAIDDLLGSWGPTQGSPIPLVARKDCPLVGGSFPEGRTLLMLRDTSGTLLDQSEVTVTGGDRGQWSEAQVWVRVWTLFQGSQETTNGVVARAWEAALKILDG